MTTTGTAPAAALKAASSSGGERRGAPKDAGATIAGAARRQRQGSGLLEAWHKARPFVNGWVAGSTALLAVQPADVFKMRYQMGSKLGFAALGKQIVGEEGVRGLYKGLDAGLARQLTYGMTRLGVFKTLTEKAKKLKARRMQEDLDRNVQSSSRGRKRGKRAKNQTKVDAAAVQLDLWQKSVCALAAGAIGALVGNPADLSLVRMTSDSVLPEALRKNYAGIGDCMRRIVKQDGILGLWRGAGMTVTRCMALNLGQLASADQARDVMANMGLKRDGTACILGGSIVGGFVGAGFSMPFDYVKSAMQSMQPNALGQLPYRNAVHCVTQTVAKHGPGRLYAGFVPYFFRQAPHAIITLTILEELNLLEDIWERRSAEKRQQHLKKKKSTPTSNL